MTAEDTWINTTEIRSESSDRVYVVSQHAAKRYWACSCPGWRSHRKCKHLTHLGLPNHEQPFEVKTDHAREKGFLDGYPTYDASAGHGRPADWQAAFTVRMGLYQARKELGLPKSAGWDDVRRAMRLAGAEAASKLVEEYQRVADAFGTGDLSSQAEAVRAARFRLEAYAAYLDDQQATMLAKANGIQSDLRVRVQRMGR